MWFDKSLVLTSLGPQSHQKQICPWFLSHPPVKPWLQHKISTLKTLVAGACFFQHRSKIKYMDMLPWMFQQNLATHSAKSDKLYHLQYMWLRETISDPESMKRSEDTYAIRCCSMVFHHEIMSQKLSSTSAGLSTLGSIPGQAQQPIVIISNLWGGMIANGNKGVQTEPLK